MHAGRNKAINHSAICYFRSTAEVRFWHSFDSFELHGKHRSRVWFFQQLQFVEAETVGDSSRSRKSDHKYQISGKYIRGGGGRGRGGEGGQGSRTRSRVFALPCRDR